MDEIRPDVQQSTPQFHSPIPLRHTYPRPASRKTGDETLFIPRPRIRQDVLLPQLQRLYGVEQTDCRRSRYDRKEGRIITNCKSMPLPSENTRSWQQRAASVEPAYNRRQPGPAVIAHRAQRNSSDEMGSSNNSDPNLQDRRTKLRREGAAVRRPSVPELQSNVANNKRDLNSRTYSSKVYVPFGNYTPSAPLNAEAISPVQDPRNHYRAETFAVNSAPSIYHVAKHMRLQPATMNPQAHPQDSHSHVVGSLQDSHFLSQSRDFAAHSAPSISHPSENDLVHQLGATNLRAHPHNSHSQTADPPHGTPSSRQTLIRNNTEPPPRYGTRHSPELGRLYHLLRTAKGLWARGPLPYAREAQFFGMKAYSDGGETDVTAIGISDKQQTRLNDVRCKGRYGSWEKTNAYLDSGATDNVISADFFDKLEFIGAATLDVDAGCDIESAMGDAMEVLGQTTISIWWFDSRGTKKEIRKKFQVIQGLYPHMIFKEDTILEYRMRADADPWPRDYQRGLLMFNRPWKGSENRRQDDEDQKKKQDANREKAKKEEKEREKKRDNDMKRDEKGRPGGDPK